MRKKSTLSRAAPEPAVLGQLPYQSAAACGQNLPDDPVRMGVPAGGRTRELVLVAKPYTSDDLTSKPHGLSIATIVPFQPSAVVR